jgi:hypothetical protein
MTSVKSMDARDERTPLVRDEDATRRARSSSSTRSRVVGGLAIAATIALGVVGRARRVALGANERTVTFTVDAGCPPEEFRLRKPGFFETSVVSVRLLTKCPPQVGGDWTFKDMSRIPATKQYSTTATVADECEYGFALVNEDGDEMYDVGGDNVDVPLKGGECITPTPAGGNLYWNRRVSSLNGANSVKWAWGHCQEECPTPPSPPIECGDGAVAQDGKCVWQCSAGFGANENGQCVACDEDCDSCDKGVCTQCKNNKYLHEGACIDACPSGYESGGTHLAIPLGQEMFTEFDVSFDAKKRYTSPIVEGTAPATTPAIYFGHAYGSTATVKADKIFGSNIEEAKYWTEVWMSAESDDICGSDRFSTGSYCTFSRPEGNGRANCCTSWGKEMTFRALVKDSTGKDSVVASGYGTRQGASGSYGWWKNGSKKANVRQVLKNAKKVKWTARITRDGSFYTWVGHNMLESGKPTGPPTYVSLKDASYQNLGAFQGFRVQKGAGWAEGGAIMRKIAAEVQTSREWTKGRVCVANQASTAALGMVGIGAHKGVTSTSARSALGDAHGISQACLDACKSELPDLVAAIEADPMDCDTIRTFPDAHCLFTAPACIREPEDNVELDMVIDQACPRVITEHVVDPDTTEVEINASA